MAEETKQSATLEVPDVQEIIQAAGNDGDTTLEQKDL